MVFEDLIEDLKRSHQKPLRKGVWFYFNEKRKYLLWISMEHNFWLLDKFDLASAVMKVINESGTRFSLPL